MLGTLEPSSELAESAYRRATATIESLARRSRDGRLLAPWAMALSCLGRDSEAQQIREQLESRGHVEPGFGELCAAGRAGRRLEGHPDVASRRAFTRTP